MSDIIKALEAKTNENIPQLASGDVVSVHVKIKEGEDPVSIGKIKRRQNKAWDG